MKSSTFKTTVLVFGLMIISNISYGQSQNRQERKEPPTFKALLKKMDKNDDGKLSKEEVKGPLKDDFTKIDTDKDGFITKKELEKAPKPNRKRAEKGRN
ncbi:MAG: EF-hand domain-containing protein [Lutibacter sp.]|jgi:Ca2+-binding EF-hand superfamily protein|nr:EF-hand domain-containing protein [Lutibacter sp.]